MRDLCVARQPIYDADTRVAGYELLFRDGTGAQARFGDPEAATAHVILSGFDVGLDDLVATAQRSSTSRAAS